MMIRLIGCWPNKHTQVRKPRETGFERQTWKRRDFPVNLATANSFHGDKLIRLSANDSFLVQTRLRANTSTDISFPIYMYIYISMLSAPLMHLIVSISARLVSMGEWKLQIEGGKDENLTRFRQKKHRLSA